MINKKKFFDEYRKKLDKTLTNKEVAAIDLFIGFVNTKFKYFSLVEWAYVLATTYHETAQTFEPVREAFWKSEAWRKRNFRYFPFYGRGYVQLTWEFNYQRASTLLGVDFVNNPDLTMQAEYAFKIMIDGMKKGWYTSKKVSDYIKDGKPNYKGMRRVINGTDKAQLIADYANEFQRILKIATE